jgi:hypothetical protein
MSTRWTLTVMAARYIVKAGLDPAIPRGTDLRGNAPTTVS